MASAQHSHPASSQLLSEIVQAGIKDPVLFELVGLFEEGIGADRISDMTISIILSDLLKFTERVAKNLLIDRKSVRVRGVVYKIPHVRNGRRPVVLIPKELLTPLPVALDWDEIDYVGAHNEELRSRVNRIVGKTWKLSMRRLSKADVKQILLDSPASLRRLIEEYKKRPAAKYDFDRDPLGEIIWHQAGINFAHRYPLPLSPVTSKNILDVITTICRHFKSLIESNGLFRLLYDDTKKLKHERAAQLVFFGIADAYCAANNLELSREPNAGRGPVDFKLSKGYRIRVMLR